MVMSRVVLSVVSPALAAALALAVSAPVRSQDGSEGAGAEVARDPEGGEEGEDNELDPAPPDAGPPEEAWQDGGSAEAEPDPGPLSLSLTTSGGVSLGAYQAGYLFYLSEVIKKNPEVFEVHILTGSSAGMVNSMITLMSLGGEEQGDPRASLYYRLWTEIHYRELLDVEDAPPLALSSRKVMENLADSMENVWLQGLHEDLDMVVGATATRVKGRSVKLSQGFSVPRQEEKFVFRVRGRGKGKAPLISNYVDQSHGIAQPLLPFSESGKRNLAAARKDFDVIRQVMFASSAFPLAFPPQLVDFCMSTPEFSNPEDLEAFRDCPTPRYHELFVDGSMFDRNPLGLAHRTSKAGLGRDGGGGVSWQETPDMRHGVLPENFYFIYLDAGHASYPTTEKARETDNIEALFPTFGAYSQGFVRAAQAKELYTLVDDNPEVKGHVEFTTRDLPTASGLLANFFGFFERRLRIFDFYLGMHDARRYVETVLAGKVEEERGEEVEIVYPEDRAGEAASDSWRRYHCLRAVIDEEEDPDRACAGDDMEDFRILLQVSIDRLYDHCSGLQMDETIEHNHCKRAMEGRAPPRVVGPLEEGDEDIWRKEPGESDFQHTMRLLKEYRFWFEDLGLKRRHAWMAMSRIREELGGRLDSFAKKLPYGERIVLRTIGKPALNFFQYQPPAAILYLGAGMGVELGLSVSTKVMPTRWFRFNLALHNQGLLQLFSGLPNVWAVTPLAGFEIEIPQLSSPAFQGRIGVRVGYQLSTGDSFLRDGCRADRFENDSAMCSAPLGQAMFVFGFYERVRIQGGVVWFPHFFEPMKSQGRGRWGGFVQVGWQWISPF